MMKLQFDTILTSNSKKTCGYVFESGNKYYVELDYCGCCFFHSMDKKLHREDGPAEFSCTGELAWYKNDKLYREDGPAFIDGNYTEFWLNEYLSKDDFLEKLKDKIIYINDKPYLIDGRLIQGLDNSNDYEYDDYDENYEDYDVNYEYEI